MNNTIDPRAKRWGMFAKYAALLGIGFIVAPFIFSAITGLIGLIVAAAIMLGTWAVLPAVEAAAANFRLKLIKAEAARNPVLTLQNELREKTVALDERKTAIEKLSSKIRTFGDKVDDIKEHYGAQDSGYVKLSADLVDLKKIYVNRCEKWKAARNQLDKFAEAIDRAEMIWEAGLAAAAAREESGLSEEEFYSRLRTETAFDSIQDGYNQALASLDSSMLDEPAMPPALPPSSSVIIDISTPNTTKVAR